MVARDFKNAYLELFQETHDDRYRDRIGGRKLLVQRRFWKLSLICLQYKKEESAVAQESKRNNPSIYEHKPHSDPTNHVNFYDHGWRI